MIICPFCGTIQMDPWWESGDECPECGVGVLIDDEDTEDLEDSEDIEEDSDDEDG